MKDNTIKEIRADQSLIAYCGLYCGSCGSYLKGKCAGCKVSEKLTWCSIRKCCIENSFQSCADCTAEEVRKCKKYNTFISKLIGFILNSDRAACVERIRSNGYGNFASEMAEKRIQTIKRK